MTRQTTTADFTIADVLAWARTKPAGETYLYTDSSGCALCQFLNETGRAERASVTDFDWASTPLAERNLLPANLNAAVQGCGVWDVAENVKWSFGEMVKRLEALCPETPVNASNWQAIDAYLTDIEDVARERCSA